ncbi:Glutamine synthetase type I [hydrothermal vent metagenome]|uniref:Glutamine synthetase type I n=1 Tax=hydrothermal vent metagenome TaxID=652676 RepID=A0A3B0S5S5_9ZZZZ
MRNGRAHVRHCGLWRGGWGHAKLTIQADDLEAIFAGLGWGPYQNDHEDANGQFEMNWEFGDALSTADKHSFSSS